MLFVESAGLQKMFPTFLNRGYAGKRKIAYVLTTLFAFVLCTFPGQPCVCNDGTLKLVCGGDCSTGNCCCGQTAVRSKGPCCRLHGLRSGCESPCRSAHDVNDHVSKNCCCTQIAKDRLVLDTETEPNINRPHSMARCVAPTILANLWCLQINNAKMGPPPLDVIIALQRLVI